MEDHNLLHNAHCNSVRMARDRGFRISPHNAELEQLDAEQVKLMGRARLHKVFCRWSAPLGPDKQGLADEMEGLVRECVEQTSREPEERINILESEILASGVALQEVLYVHHLHNADGGQVRVRAARDLLMKFELLLDTFGEHRTSGVVISAAPLTPAAAAALHPVKDQLSLFGESELLVLAIDHRYTSKHSLLTPFEAASYLAANGNTPEKNALIRSSDPVVRYYGWRPGNVIRIIRDYSSLDMPAPLCVAYRTVVPDC